ncbi:MAG TPA: hypothetical protein VLN45_04685 [Ignavibacteriaceae bacterium]|nr:hypothetical protein [Ignavibacteriaceae bacterium]
MNSVIHTPTSKLETSISFYEKLGFKRLSENPIIFTDGKAIIEINPDRSARAGIKLFKESWTKEISQLKEITAVANLANGFLISDPSGVWIFLIETKEKPNYKTEDSSFSTLGNFAGLSLETTDFNRSANIYEVLGFTQSMGSIEYGYVSYKNSDDLTVTLMKALMCPHLFFNPSLTYFNGKNNLSVIEKIRSLNIPITEEITYFNKEGIVDNIIIRDPGGYGFFIFSD